MDFKAYIAEFIGTFTLIFIGVGAIAGNFLNGSASGLTGIALAHGLAIGVMASAFGAISGGHFNPAVTLGVLSTKRIDLTNALGYIFAQLLGATFAAILIKLCVPAQALSFTNFGTPNLGTNITPLMGIISEIVLTFFLVIVIFGTAVDPRAPKVGGLFIGLAVTLDIFMGAPISGAAMNPARHFGPALIGGHWENFWIYWIGPIIGGILASQVYQKIFLDK